MQIAVRDKSFHIPGQVFSLKISCVSEAEDRESNNEFGSWIIKAMCRITLVKITKRFTIIFGKKSNPKQYIIWTA